MLQRMAILSAMMTMACNAATGGGAAVAEDTAGDSQLSDGAATDAISPGDAVADAADVGANTCPAQATYSGACSGSLTCNYGQECCCGKCYPSTVCSCNGGQWGCYATDACLIPPQQCGDASADAQPDSQPDAMSVPWTLFSVTTGGFCPTDCTQTWNVSPDGILAMKKSGVSSSGKLSAADASTLHAILDAPGFLAKMKGGFTCDPPPTDIGYSFSYALSGVKYDQDVTGCQISGGADNALVHSVTKIVMAY